MKNQLLLLLSFFLLTSMAAHAVKVEGTVLDENKETVIGATVQLKGAAGVGTITDMDGKIRHASARCERRRLDCVLYRI